MSFLNTGILIVLLAVTARATVSISFIKNNFKFNSISNSIFLVKLFLF